MIKKESDPNRLISTVEAIEQALALIDEEETTNNIENAGDGYKALRKTRAILERRPK